MEIKTKVNDQDEIKLNFLNYRFILVVGFAFLTFFTIPFVSTAQADVQVTIPKGTSTLGCEETNQCFIPNKATVEVGESVTWINKDTASHTVTSGYSRSGPSDIFDSGLFMPGEKFTYVFEEAGEYPYYCMVHPWMNGTVIVRPTDISDSNSGKIVFGASVDSNRDIYVMNADGTDVTRLTNNPNVDDSPSWSPDGSKIVFTSNRDGNNEIYTMNADGSEITRMTYTEEAELRPSWSPDGSKIVFEKITDYRALYVMDVDEPAKEIKLIDLTGTKSYPTWSPDSTKIAFTLYRGSYDIFIINSDGTGLRNLSTTPNIDEFSPSWSPDGTEIVFRSNRHNLDADVQFGRGSDLYVLDIEDSRVTRLTYDDLSETEPSWSPNSDKIIFVSDSGRNIYTINRDGSNPHRITDDGSYGHPSWFSTAITSKTKGYDKNSLYNRNKIAFSTSRDGNNEIYVMSPDGTQKNLSRNPANEYHPAWSPDGSKIAFTSDRDGDREIYVMDADGTNQKQLTKNNIFDQHPTWSPNGKQIAYRSDFDGAEIYKMNADGSGKKNLSRMPSSGEGDPAWSPDGSKIVFFSNIDGNNEIYVMDARDGSDKTRLTRNGASDRFPAWSPDGSKIVFTSKRDGNSNIYVVRIDEGDEAKPLTTSSAFDNHPAWSPDGSKIAFTSNRDGGKKIYFMDVDDGNTQKMSKESSQGRFPDWYPLKESFTNLPTLNQNLVSGNIQLETIINTLPKDDLLREKIIKKLNEVQGVSPCLIVASMDQSDIVVGDKVSFDLALVGEFANNRNVAVSVVNPTGFIILSRAITVDQNGLANFDFKLPTDAVAGDYKVALTHSSGQEIHKESLQFTVNNLNSMQSSDNVKILSIRPADQQGNPVDSFRKGGLGYAKVTVSGDVNNASLTTVNIFDSQSTSLGVGSFKGTVTGKSEMIISFYIPDDAATGRAKIFANIFSDWPTMGGTPLAKEASTTVTLTE